jgi:iron complex outermembrane receptor protein
VKLARNDSELARLVGIPDLKEEQSMNFSAGLTWHARPNTAVTADIYRIDIDDRIVLTGGFSADDADIGAIIEAQNLLEARFFTNAIDTRTQGLDFTVTNTAGPWSSSLALNLNETDVLQVNTAPGLAGKEDIYFNKRERLFVQGSAPKTKGVLSGGYRAARWNAGARLNYFGEMEAGTWTQIDDPESPSQQYDARVTTDVHVGFSLPRNLGVSIGGTNILDVQPTEQDPFETENGARWENVQMGINGAAYYVRVSWKR